MDQVFQIQKRLKINKKYFFENGRGSVQRPKFVELNSKKKYQYEFKKFLQKFGRSGPTLLSHRYFLEITDKIRSYDYFH